MRVCCVLCLSPGGADWLHAATSAIDYETDRVTQESLRRALAGDVTVITIAHRLQTIMDSSRIVRRRCLYHRKWFRSDEARADGAGCGLNRRTWPTGGAARTRGRVPARACRRERGSERIDSCG
jgi:hypothetical protein